MNKLLAGVLLCSGCASPWASVKDAKTIEEARQRLGAYEVTVTPYPPRGEAWYFGKNECVLFLDGKVRLSKSSYTETDGRPVHAYRQKQVLCLPSDVKD